MNKKQYEAFKAECIKRDGWLMIAGMKCRSVKERDEVYATQLHYNDHDSLQRIIDSLPEYEMDCYIKELHVLIFGIKPYKSATDSVVREYLKATVEQKQVALYAVFG